MFGCGKQKKFHKRKVVCSNPGNGGNVVNLGKGTGRLNNDVARLNRCTASSDSVTSNSPMESIRLKPRALKQVVGG